MDTTKILFQRKQSDRTKRKPDPLFFGSVFSLMLALACVLSGCIRLWGSAGYSYQGEDETPKSKQVGFDTQKLTGQPDDSDQTKGSITL